MLHRFAVADIAPTPWKNGGGVTRQLACWPPDPAGGRFDWRVSMAEVAAGGPFSAYPDVDRHILLLRGAGMVLRGTASPLHHRLDTLLQPFAFSGDEPLECTLIDGACTDLNLMARRGAASGAPQVLRQTAALPRVAHGFLLAWAGDWRAEFDACTVLLPQGHGLWWAEAPQGARLRPAQADAALIAIGLQAAEADRKRPQSLIP